MVYYTIYRVTNKINGKIYIGSHKTNNLNDGYMGSGKYLNRAIEKHGLESFQKEILFVFDTPEEMYAKEAELVNEDFLVEANTYNLRKGGLGGFDYINQTQKNIYGKNGENGKPFIPLAHKLLAEARKDAVFAEQWNKNVSDALKQRYATTPHHWLGRKHTDTTKRLISQKAKEHQAGERNSQYGTQWITNGIENRKVKKHLPIPAGFSRGRTYTQR